MTARPYLTDNEIREITYPLTQPAAIRRWFEQNGFAGAKIKPNGLPLIFRSAFHLEQEPALEKPPVTLDASEYLKKFGKSKKSREMV